jgi:hypothetical protein
MPAAKISALILKQLRSGSGVGDCGAFGRYQDFGICPKRAHRSKTPRRPRRRTLKTGPITKMRSPILQAQRSPDPYGWRWACSVADRRRMRPFMIELDSGEVNDGAIFPFGARPEEGIR